MPIPLNEINYDSQGNPHYSSMIVETFKEADNLIQGMYEHSNAFYAWRIEQNKDGTRKWQLLNELNVPVYELKYTSL